MVHVIPLIVVFVVIIIIFLYISKNNSKKEGFQNTPKEQTPGERGLVFGYVPKNIPITTNLTNSTNSTNSTNAINSGDSIQLYNNNKYFGYSNKNRLLPNFLERLGTFTPYSYENIKIHTKDNTSNILYNTSLLYFTIKELQETYYLQFIPNTNTFYLSNTPSYFSFINVKEPNSKSEVKYNDNILIKCLDNSEYLFVYEELVITEKDKSSTFVIKKAEQLDICANFSNKNNKDFMPKVMAKEQVAQLERQYRKDIDDHLANLKGTKSSEINTIKEHIKLLEQQLELAKGNAKIQLEKEKLKHQEVMKGKEAELNAEINKFKADKDIEFAKTKDKVIKEKKEQWLKEIDDLRTLMNKKCSKASTETKKPLVDTKKPIVDTKKPLVDTKKSIVDTKKPLVDTKKPLTDTKKPLVDTKKPLTDTKKPLNTNKS